ncbi:UPF0725 protein EMB2204-like [Eutrema salsugineum]|uniref:UPF0725 protein EMB2204-like n=1 Tax=Eutrema salsugineum TaxID=72664 RepID=UPI000CECE5AD|nr:UPF0725 protein EMB2204-like [Eutrema salsugineum]
MGIHRYNLLEGTNWKFSKLKSFNTRMNCGAAPYYITLAAYLQSSDLRQNVQVSEKDLGVLDLTCSIARPRVTNSCSSTTDEKVPFQVSTRLPHWPSSFNDPNRFCLVDLSHVSYYDWINLYLELAYCAYDRGITDCHLSKFNLKIVQVAVESPDGFQPPLIDSKTAVVYIVYKDLNKACDCKAIFRRLYDEATGRFSLKGKYWCEGKSF